MPQSLLNEGKVEEEDVVTDKRKLTCIRALVHLLLILLFVPGFSTKRKYVHLPYVDPQRSRVRTLMSLNPKGGYFLVVNTELSEVRGEKKGDLRDYADPGTPWEFFSLTQFSNSFSSILLASSAIQTLHSIPHSVPSLCSANKEKIRRDDIGTQYTVNASE